jgi:DNA-directed RNA polymerase subunit RPC12/RpoP
MAKSYIWYVCSACRSRLAVEREHTGEIRCRNCSSLIRPSKASDDIAGEQEPDEYRVAPLEASNRLREPPRATRREPPALPSGSKPSASKGKIPLPSSRERGFPPKPAADSPPNVPAYSPLDGIEIRDDERYAPAPPPRWTFFSGVFGYPWRPQSLLPWTVLSLGIGLFGFFTLMIVNGIQSGSREGAVMAGFFALAWFWLSILTGSYAAACVFAVTELTAYNYDDPYDWPEADWRERIWHLLWLGWCLLLAAAVVLGPASMIFDDLQARLLAIAIGVGLLGPILVLSTLETNSLVPFSGPIWQSVVTQPGPWISFYVLGGLLTAACGIASAWAVSKMGMLAVFVLGPMWAAWVLLYARLLGRLAWRIMSPTDEEVQTWRQARKPSLAADVRRRQQRHELEAFAKDQ